MSEPSPGAGITDSFQNGPASNLFARQLAKRENIERLVGFMLDDFEFEMELQKASMPSAEQDSKEGEASVTDLAENEWKECYAHA